MIYQYTCLKCKKEIEITKTMSEVDRVEHCVCGEVLQRIWKAPMVKTSDGTKA